MSIEAGKRVGDYEILNEIGSGGMGRVYRVRNVLSDRIEAMKILLPDVATRQDLAARFQREIKVLASLNHPNIATLRTALTIDNQLVMIMEYVEGTNLAERLGQGPIPVADTLTYMDQVLNALSYAHQQHVIHRDIKPANIILTPQGVIKLMDFGIARSGDAHSLTMTGTTLGSLNYMSPEQVKGEATDARSDIYSVGISLYELVTGQRPFQAHSDYSIMAAHVKEMPKPPIELAHELDPALNEIILMAIAKDPAQRFQTADAFRNALHNVHVAPSVAASAPAASPDAVTATLAVPTPPPAIPATVPAQPASAAKVAPVSTPPAMPVPPPPHPASHRGLYMTLGALIVLAVLVAAAVYVPRRSKTQASPASPSQTQSAGAAQSTSPSPQAGTEQTPPAAATPASTEPTSAPPPSPDAASTAASAGSTSTPPTAVPAASTTTSTGAATTPTPAVPTPPTESVPATTSSTTPPATAAPSQSHRTHQRRASGAKSSSGPVVNATLQEAEPSAPPKQATGTATSDAANAAAAPANDAASQAALDELKDQLDQLSNRASAADSTLSHLEQQQNSAGYGLRGDIVAKRASMKTNLSKAKSALQQGNLDRAKKYFDLAQGDVEALEKFLGH